MPRVDMDMSSGRMGRWHAVEGAHVVKGATLFEIETDKAAMEVDAPASGVLKFIAASEGDVLPVGACIGWIVAEDESFVALPAKADAAGETAPPPPLWGRDGVGGRTDTGGRNLAREPRSGASQEIDQPQRVGAWRDPPPSLPHKGGGDAPRVHATPAARRMAREQGLRLESVNGSGPQGRVQRRDVEQ